jgi:adenylosuccinate lyase
MDVQQELTASFSTLVLSIASSAAISLGLAPNPATNQIEKDLRIAQFNIDLLVLLKIKTDKNLTEDEQKYLNTVISDLQMKFVQAKA